MKTSKSISVIILMLFVAAAADLVLLAILNLLGSAEAQRTTIKLGEGCAVVAIALFGLSSCAARSRFLFSAT